MIRRLGAVALAWLVLIDCVACTAWLSPLYLVGLADRPSGRQLISAYVGAAAINGRRWGLRAAAVIDRLFWWSPDHCRACFRRYGAD